MKKKKIRYNILSALLCVGLLTACGSKNTLSDIQVNAMQSELYTEGEYYEFLDEFVTGYNEKAYGETLRETEIIEISYLGDACLQQEIADLANSTDEPALDLDSMQFMLMRIKADITSFWDKFNLNESYPQEFTYFLTKKPNAKWEVQRSGDAGYVPQCEFNK